MKSIEIEKFIPPCNGPGYLLEESVTQETFTTFQKSEKVQIEMKPPLHVKYQKYEIVETKCKNWDDYSLKNAKWSHPIISDVENIVIPSNSI